MEAVQHYLHELAQTRKFSDFTFKVEGGQDHKVHKVVLAAQSRIFEKFFEQHESEASLVDLFSFSNSTAPIDTDKYSNIAMREAMIDVLAYCYYGRYSLNRERETSGDFAVRVLSHLLVHEAAIQFQIADLATLSAIKFRSEFHNHCQSGTPDRVQGVFKTCFSTAIVSRLLHDTAIEMFRIVIDAYKKGNRFREALDLMGAVPMATAELYSQPPTQEEDVSEGGEDVSEADESADEDEELAPDDHHSSRSSQKEEYASA